MAGLAAAEVGECSDAELGAQIAALSVLAGRLEAQRLRRLAVFDGRGAGAGSRGGSTAGWLGWVTRQGPRQAARAVRVARALDRRLAGTAAALAAGQISEVPPVFRTVSIRLSSYQPALLGRKAEAVVLSFNLLWRPVSEP